VTSKNGFSFKVRARAGCTTWQISLQLLVEVSKITLLHTYMYFPAKFKDLK